MSLDFTTISFSQLAARRRALQHAVVTQVTVQFRVHQGVFRCSEALAHVGLAVIVEADDGEDTGIIVAVNPRAAAGGDHPRVTSAATKTEIADYAFTLEALAREAHASLLVLQHLAAADLFQASTATQDAAAARVVTQLDEYGDVGAAYDAPRGLMPWRGAAAAHRRRPLHEAVQGALRKHFTGTSTAADFLCSVTIMGVAFQADRRRLSVYYRVKNGDTARYKDVAAALGSYYHCRVWMHDVKHPGSGPKPRFSYPYHPPALPVSPAELHAAALAMVRPDLGAGSTAPATATVAPAAAIETRVPAPPSTTVKQCEAQAPCRRARDATPPPPTQPVPMICTTTTTTDFYGAQTSSSGKNIVSRPEPIDAPACPAPFDVQMARGAAFESDAYTAAAIVTVVPSYAVGAALGASVGFLGDGPAMKGDRACDPATVKADAITEVDADDAATVLGGPSTPTPPSPPPAPAEPVRVVLPQYVPTTLTKGAEKAASTATKNDTELDDDNEKDSADFYAPLIAARVKLRATRADSRAATARFDEAKEQFDEAKVQADQATKRFDQAKEEFETVQRAYIREFNACWSV